MNTLDAEELADAVLGLTDDQLSEGVDYDDLMDDRFGVSLEQFADIADALIPFTIPGKTALLGATCHGFVKDGAFIVKRPA